MPDGEGLRDDVDFLTARLRHQGRSGLTEQLFRMLRTEAGEFVMKGQLM